MLPRYLVIYNYNKIIFNTYHKQPAVLRKLRACTVLCKTPTDPWLKFKTLSCLKKKTHKISHMIKNMKF